MAQSSRSSKVKQQLTFGWAHMLLCMPTKSNSTPDFLISCHKMSKASDPMKPKKEFSKSHAMRASCQRGPRANVLACLRANVPKSSQLLIYICQRVKQRAIVLTWRPNVPNGVPIFQLGVPMCQKACQFFKHFSYQMLWEISILYYYIKNSTLYLIP